jgi:hypothetical protein
MIQAKFGLNWPSGFRGEDFFKSLQTDDRGQVMAIAHTGELKSVQKNKPLCLHFDRFWHWKPCYYYIYWTLFSAHCL